MFEPFSRENTIQQIKKLVLSFAPVVRAMPTDTVPGLNHESTSGLFFSGESVGIYRLDVPVSFLYVPSSDLFGGGSCTLLTTEQASNCVLFFICCPDVHGAMTCNQKSFKLVWRIHQLLSVS